MTATITILDPVAPPGEAAAGQAFRPLASLAGKVVGFIDNAKLNFNHLADDLEALLKERYGIAGVVRHRKRGSVATGDAVMRQLAEQCDAVITGSGD